LYAASEGIFAWIAYVVVIVPSFEISGSI
jgi:hypothetical protein